jgi:tRNA-splicing ligase RtcB
MDNRLNIFGDHEEDTVRQMNTALDHESAVRGVLCADGHLGYTVPIGGVIAYRQAISPSAVGYDIACGNAAVKTNLHSEDVLPILPEILDEIQRRVSFGVGSTGDGKDHGIFHRPEWKEPFLEELKVLAISQLGSVGAGNHFVDLFLDHDNHVWVGVHFGSRGLGHKIATFFVKEAGGKNGMHAEPAVIPFHTPLGQDYFTAMNLAGDYAYAGREKVVDLVVGDILQADYTEMVHNNHNFAWQEYHDGEFYFVVRKGSTPAWPDQRSFIGGSMGDVSVIVRGIDSNKSREALHSTVHGAGRVLSRSKAAGKTKYKKGRRVRVSEGVVSREMMEEWLDDKGVLLRGGGTDESPHCYRRLSKVLKHHEGTIEVETVLHPIGVVMAGD